MAPVIVLALILATVLVATTGAVVLANAARRNTVPLGPEVETIEPEAKREYEHWCEVHRIAPPLVCEWEQLDDARKAPFRRRAARGTS